MKRKRAYFVVFSIVIFGLLSQDAYSQPGVGVKPKIGGKVSIPDHDAITGEVHLRWYLENRDRNLVFYHRGARQPGLPILLNPPGLLVINSETGLISVNKGGIQFPDGSIQTKALLIGPQGLPGKDGVDGTDGKDGARGPQGPPGPPTKSVVVCINGDMNLVTDRHCSCPGGTLILKEMSPCTVTSETGPCSATSILTSGTRGSIRRGSCCVCAP